MRVLGQKTPMASGNIPKSVKIEDFMIGNLGISNQNYLITGFTQTPLSEVAKFNNPLSHGQGFVAQYMRGGTITLNFLVKGKNKEEFMKKLQDLYREIYGKNPILYFTINGEKRKVRVSCTSSPLNFAHYNINFVNLILNFEYYDFLETDEIQNFTFAGKSGNFSKEIQNTGNAESEFDFYFIFQENTDISKIKISNGKNFISVENSFSSGDILYISSEKKEVYKNGEIIDFDGVFLNFETKTNVLNFEFEGNILTDIFILAPKKFI